MKVQKSRHGSIHLLRLTGGVTWNELLTEIGQYAEVHGLGEDGLAEALLEREQTYPTGLLAATGIAIPHAEQIFTKRVSMVVAILETPVMFRQMGGSAGEVPVRVVFLLLLRSSRQHLDLLGSIANLIQNQDAIIELMNDDRAIEMLGAGFEGYLGGETEIGD